MCYARDFLLKCVYDGVNIMFKVFNFVEECTCYVCLVVIFTLFNNSYINIIYCARSAREFFQCTMFQNKFTKGIVILSFQLFSFFRIRPKKKKDRPSSTKIKIFKIESRVRKKKTSCAQPYCKYAHDKKAIKNNSYIKHLDFCFGLFWKVAQR